MSSRWIFCKMVHFHHRVRVYGVVFLSRNFLINNKRVSRNYLRAISFSKKRTSAIKSTNSLTSLTASLPVKGRCILPLNISKIRIIPDPPVGAKLTTLRKCSFATSAIVVFLGSKKECGGPYSECKVSLRLSQDTNR